VSLCLVPPAELQTLEHSVVTRVVKAAGTVHPLDLFDYVSECGPGLTRLHQRAAAQEKELATLAQQVERGLLLRRLSRDPLLAPEDFRSGCHRLLRHREHLWQHTEGTALRLSHRNGIKSGETVVDIAHDFEM